MVLTYLKWSLAVFCFISRNWLCCLNRKLPSAHLICLTNSTFEIWAYTKFILLLQASKQASNELSFSNVSVSTQRKNMHQYNSIRLDVSCNGPLSKRRIFIVVLFRWWVELLLLVDVVHFCYLHWPHIEDCFYYLVFRAFCFIIQNSQLKLLWNCEKPGHKSNAS
jgi:hypothetical protein